MDCVAFDFSGKFAFCEISDELEEVDLIYPFPCQEFFLQDYPSDCYLIFSILFSQKQRLRTGCANLPSR